MVAFSSRYRWEKDGEPLDSASILMKPGSGTIIITQPRDEDEGIYQCFASNAFGVAVSVKVMLRRACKY